jgi:hypothetical protein
MKKTPKTIVRKPSAAQLRDVEFSHEIRHLSSSEIDYRMKENAEKLSAADDEIVSLDARRKLVSAQRVRLQRDRAVLRAVIDIRRLDVQLT